MQDVGEIKEGMLVFSADGHKLGKIVSCDPESFVVEKGLFFVVDYRARHEDVRSIDGPDVWLSVDRDNLQRVDELGVNAGGSRVGAADAPDAGVEPRSVDTAAPGSVAPPVDPEPTAPYASEGGQRDEDKPKT